MSHDAAKAMFAADLASRALGIEVLEIGEGRAVVSMRVRADMVNGHGIAHGGHDDLLVATAEVRTRHGRNGSYDVTVHRADPDGRTVIAEFRGRSREVAK